MPNRYHILYRLPLAADKALPEAREKQARRLVTSGKLRIKTDYIRNFAPYSGSGFDKSFSYRELTDPNLLADTRRAIRDTLPGYASEDAVEEVVVRLIRQCKGATSLSAERELEIARLIVQCAEPVIIDWCLYEKVEIFVSYAHDVADLMAVHFWDEMQSSGGLQAVSGDGAAVYVSCGGNPFITEEEQKTYRTDGFDALARMQVIGAQEFGHYADLRRDDAGRIIGRHSASLSPFRASDTSRAARQSDQDTVRGWQQAIHRSAIAKLAKQEQAYAFFKTHRPCSLMRALYWSRCQLLRQRIKQQARQEKNALVSQFPATLEGGSGWATNLLDCLEDMAFNLSPAGEAYERESPEEAEAIACIEALARVPQQCVKWGHEVTRLCWPRLYTQYYHTIIPEKTLLSQKLIWPPTG